MSPTKPIDWRAARDAIVRWAEQATGLVVVWGNQSAPQPAWPYISLLTTAGQAELGTVPDEQWTSDGGLQLVEQRDFGVSMQVHVGPPNNASPDCDAVSIVHAALSSLSLPSTAADLAEAGVALRDRGQPQTIDLVVGSEWISRQVVDLRFGVASVLSLETAPQLDQTGHFEQIRVTSTVDGIVNPGGTLELTDELMDPNP